MLLVVFDLFVHTVVHCSRFCKMNTIYCSNLFRNPHFTCQKNYNRNDNRVKERSMILIPIDLSVHVVATRSAALRTTGTGR